MPVAGLIVPEVLKLTDETNPDFVGFPEGETPEEINEVVSENWANAVAIGLGGLVTPPGAGAVAAGAVGPAAAAMKVALEAGTPGLVELVTAFGAAIELALAPLAPVQGTFLLTPLPPTDDPNPPALSFELDVVKWVALGLWTPPPVGPPLPWT